MSVKSTVYIQKEDSWYVATSIETGVASQGKTIDEALSNLTEALSLYFENNTPEKPSIPVLITTLEVAI